jgi:hypothetical protein
VTNQNLSVSSTSAPALGLLRSFAATVAAGPDPDNADVLATRERAIPWLRAQGLMAADAMLTGSEHGALLRLRGAFREALAAHAAGRNASPEIAARLTRALADGRLVVTITDAGSVKLATAARSAYPSVVAAIAVAIAEAEAAGAWESLTSPGPPREPDPVSR